MTLEKHLQEHLVDHGLWPQEAGAAVANYGAEDDSVAPVLCKSVAGYPAPAIVAIEIAARGFAVRLLETTKPKHFALHVLRGSLPGGGNAS